jgi:hypothetical protein
MCHNLIQNVISAPEAIAPKEMEPWARNISLGSADPEGAKLFFSLPFLLSLRAIP